MLLISICTLIYKYHKILIKQVKIKVRSNFNMKFVSKIQILYLRTVSWFWRSIIWEFYFFLIKNHGGLNISVYSTANANNVTMSWRRILQQRVLDAVKQSVAIVNMSTKWNKRNADQAQHLADCVTHLSRTLASKYIVTGAAEFQFPARQVEINRSQTANGVSQFANVLRSALSHTQRSGSEEESPKERCTPFVLITAWVKKLFDFAPGRRRPRRVLKKPFIKALKSKKARKRAEIFVLLLECLCPVLAHPGIDNIAGKNLKNIISHFLPWYLKKLCCWIQKHFHFK